MIMEGTTVNIEKVDRNFVVAKSIEKSDVVFYDADNAPFKVYGLFRENGRYCRIPEKVAKSVNDGVAYLNLDTAGGRVRFITDSPYVAIKAETSQEARMPHFALTGSAGFDMYSGKLHAKTFVPPLDIKGGYESVFDFTCKSEREITINFPLYSNVKKLYIGLQKGADVREPVPYKSSKPIVYYGSSITQGASASRPGMSYQSIISRRFDCDFINLGFSGSALGEDAIVEYIKNLDMSLFVCDYDHNAPSSEHLKATHERMFKAIRAAHPTLPVILMPRPKFTLTEEEKVRREIVENTYLNAVSAGDKNVYFIDNKELCALCGDDGTVDNCHPTDLGFASMAAAVGDVVEKIGCI